ncbi:MAG: type II secretion system F family protein [Chlamydiota bacterium]|jgi:general secretion pathway protein F/type IV pilus assembly protein PilC
MPIYQYKAISEKGKKSKGILDAPSINDVQKKLFEKKLIPLDISLLKKNALTKNLSLKEILSFSRELAKLLSASLPLYESLVALEEKYRSQKIHPVIVDLCDQIQKGISFSKALESFSNLFDPLFRSIVKNSEQTGNLAEALHEASELIAKQLSLKKQVISTLIYPAILMGFSFVILLSLFFFVIPTLKDLFEDRNVHFFTKLILNLSAFLNAHVKFFFFSLFTIFCLIGISFFYRPLKNAFSKVLLNAPVLGKLTKKTALIRYCRAMSSLLEGGVSFMETLPLARKVMDHPLLESHFAKIESKILEGKSFSEQLLKIPYVPILMSRMVAIAEKSGKLPQMLRQIADIEDEDLRKNLLFLTSVLQPVILLVLGTIVGLVLLAVLLPLTDVSSFMNY